MPDALMVLVRLLASLHDDERQRHGGRPARKHSRASGLSCRAGAGRVRFAGRRAAEIGSGIGAAAVWAKPAITVIGIDTTSIAASSNTLIPRARAKVSMRVAPGGDAAGHLDLLRDHLVQHAPWGAQVTVTSRRRRSAVCHRRQRPGLRRRAGGLSASVGRRTD